MFLDPGICAFTYFAFQFSAEINVRSKHNWLDVKSYKSSLLRRLVEG
jgi:hypothetical protein